jgi:hypothetical protein
MPNEGTIALINRAVCILPHTPLRQLLPILDRALQDIVNESCDAVFVQADPIRPTIVKLAAAARIPDVYQIREIRRGWRAGELWSTLIDNVEAFRGVRR